MTNIEIVNAINNAIAEGRTVKVGNCYCDGVYHHKGEIIVVWGTSTAGSRGVKAANLCAIQPEAGISTLVLTENEVQVIRKQNKRPLMY